MHINTIRERRRKEKANNDVTIQSTTRFKEESGECYTIHISDEEKADMIKRARKPLREDVTLSN